MPPADARQQGAFVCIQSDKRISHPVSRMGYLFVISLR